MLMANHCTEWARLYEALAEALAEPPPWLTRAGCKWPLFDMAINFARQDDRPALRAAIAGLATINAESRQTRCARYERLFLDVTRPHLSLYESMARDGHLAGPRTFAVQSIYASAGLVVAGAELPDYASMELAFLAYLFDQEAQDPAQATKWRMARRQFVKQHAAQWLPSLGEALAATGDPVYGPVGLLLSASLHRELHARRHLSRLDSRRLPTLPDAEQCNLCGFCVQICPSHALAIRETADTTALLLTASACIGCGQCLRTCETGALRQEQMQADASPSLLRQSTRVRCSGCGEPTVSQAELDAIASRIGKHAWLNYCLECRAILNGVAS